MVLKSLPGIWGCVLLFLCFVPLFFSFSYSIEDGVLALTIVKRGGCFIAPIRGNEMIHWECFIAVLYYIFL